ncbi:MAG: SAM-dependent methyltransferase, partial [Alphaproteobacteria bacterium]|nr:SAM-dependent methyltransferase [Alphaproteobacteria bacterium]
PNISKRQRFFASAAGQAFHRRFTGQEEVPSEAMTETQEGKINDDIVLALLARARAAGCDAYLVPQGASLPMANRREDVIIRKP